MLVCVSYYSNTKVSVEGMDIEILMDAHVVVPIQLIIIRTTMTMENIMVVVGVLVDIMVVLVDITVVVMDIVVVPVGIVVVGMDIIVVTVEDFIEDEDTINGEEVDINFQQT